MNVLFTGAAHHAAHTISPPAQGVDYYMWQMEEWRSGGGATASDGIWDATHTHTHTCASGAAVADWKWKLNVNYIEFPDTRQSEAGDDLTPL